MLAALKQRIMQKADELLNAQMTIACGMSFVYRIVKDEEGKIRKTEMVTNPEEILEFMKEHHGAPGTIDDSYYYITTSRPEQSAIDSMFNRAFGRPTEMVEVSLGDPLGDLIKEFKATRERNEQ